MKFTLPRLFIATAILAAAMALARVSDSVPVALLIGCPLAVVTMPDHGGLRTKLHRCLRPFRV